MNKEEWQNVIPCGDQVCINCENFGRCNPDACEKCENYSDEGTENNFEPSEDYLDDEYKCCENCRHYNGGLHDWKNACGECKRIDRDDMWEAK